MWYWLVNLPRRAMVPLPLHWRPLLFFYHWLDLACGVFGSKHSARRGWGAVRWLTRSFRFVILSTTVTLLLLAAWATFGPHDESFRWLFYWLLPIIVGYSFIELVSAKLQLEERYNALSLWRMMPQLAHLLLVLMIVFWHDRRGGY